MQLEAFVGVDSFPQINGQVAWKSPSNIALTKYWGKHGEQMPRNPSISFTLQNAYTETRVLFESSSRSDEVAVDFYFEGEKNEAFAERINGFLNAQAERMPYVRHFQWKIESSNSFPHSSGIASSASSMSALILCLCDIEREYLGLNLTEEDWRRRTSFLSRLASGSACRSVYPRLAQWGLHSAIEASSDLFAIPMEDILHTDFDGFHDDILIIDEKEKSVSSSAGHGLMDANPYASIRYEQAGQNTVQIINAIKSGDLENFIQIVESEALTLHALMMSSTPSYMLMRPGTLTAIEKIRAFRHDTGIPITFTLDAGPNVHILYPESDREECHSFIQSELRSLSPTDTVIRDGMGPGPIRTEE